MVSKSVFLYATKLSTTVMSDSLQETIQKHLILLLYSVSVNDNNDQTGIGRNYNKIFISIVLFSMINLDSI